MVPAAHWSFVDCVAGRLAQNEASTCGDNPSEKRTGLPRSAKTLLDNMAAATVADLRVAEKTMLD